MASSRIGRRRSATSRRKPCSSGKPERDDVALDAHRAGTPRSAAWSADARSGASTTSGQLWRSRSMSDVPSPLTGAAGAAAAGADVTVGAGASGVRVVAARLGQALRPRTSLRAAWARPAASRPGPHRPAHAGSSRLRRHRRGGLRGRSPRSLAGRFGRGQPARRPVERRPGVRPRGARWPRSVRRDPRLRRPRARLRRLQFTRVRNRASSS